jgi:hypothetical protein
MQPVLEPTAGEFESVPMGTATAADAIPLPASFMAEHSNGYNADKERVRHEPAQLTPRSSILTHLKGDVDPEQATAPLVAYCFMTGMMCVNRSFFFLIPVQLLNCFGNQQRLCIILCDFCMVWISNW